MLIETPTGPRKGLSHAIIVPFRDRLAHLMACVRWLKYAMASDPGDLWNTMRLVVCESPGREGSLSHVLAAEHWIDWLVCNDPMPIFNKNVLLNIGIEHALAARAKVLTFLDCDSLVGTHFARGAKWLNDQTDVTRLCYRVRYLPESTSTFVGVNDPHLDDLVHEAFVNYATLDLAHEGRVLPEWNLAVGEPLFGNSQWSICSHVLGKLRFDERYVGAGYEDLSMLRTIWRHYGSHYKAVMPKEPSENIVQLSHVRDQVGWRTKEIMDANHNRYQMENQSHENH